jgi:excisionase family DNA binding protein
MKQEIIKDTELRLLSVKEVCERLNLGHWAVNQQILHKKTLKSVKIGKRRLVSTRALEEFINSMEK